MITLAAASTLQGVAGSATAITATVYGDEVTTTDAFKTLYQGQLPSSAGVLYTVPGSTQALIKTICLVNTTAGAVTVVLFTGGTAASNRIVNLTLQANGFATYDADGWKNYDATGQQLYVGATGATGATGSAGSNGTNGWSPILAVVSNGSGGFVFQIVSWTGGTGSPPSSTNQFIGSSGIVGTAAAAQDIRGAAGAGVATGGTTGQVLLKNSATNFDASFANTPVDGSTITITGNNVAGVPNAGITKAKIVNSAANSMLGEFTGSSAAPQDLALAANTFPARASTGNLAAKPITDAGLSWLNQASIAAMTAALNVATTTTAGTLSAIDKKRLVSLQYDLVADFGGVGDDSTLNDTAFSTALSTMPVGSKLLIPAGTFRVSAAIDINVDKRIQFQGLGRYNSIIKTTSATAHIFTKSVAGWYDSWSDLGFQTSVTRTAGAAINIPIGNNIGMNVYRCWMTGMFHGINATGAQSANLSVWSDLDISAVANSGRGIVINGSTINVQIHNTTINAGSATSSACCEINQSGAVQVTSFDWIQGTNVILINSTAGAGPQACYFTNGFCDQPSGSVVKIVGTNTANRIKFNSVGIAPTGNNYAVEINGTGAGAVGTATALPAGLSFVDCDIYSANGTNTAAGFFVNGCQDINIQNCRITGFAGTGGAAIKVAPTSVTQVRVNGCIIGPNSNLTVTNATGISVSAASIGRLIITDNSIRGWTVAGITDASTTTFATDKNINNNDGAQLTGGGVASNAAQAIAAATLTQVTGTLTPLPANLPRVGTVLRWTINGATAAAAGTAVNTIQIRIGTAGTTADAVHQTFTTPVGTATAGIGFHIVLEMVISAVGGSANSNTTCTIVNGSASTGLINVYNFVGIGTATAFNSANNNFAHVALTTGAAKTLNLTGAYCEVVSP